MSRARAGALGLALAACGAAPTTTPGLVTITGQVDDATFPAPVTLVTARSDQGGHVSVAPTAGAFTLPVQPGAVWALGVEAADAGFALALPRPGHFDRALLVEAGGRPLDLGLVRLAGPTPGELVLVPEASPAGCAAGLTPDGGWCAVEQAQGSCSLMGGSVSAADLVLGYGTLADLPGASRGARFAVPSQVPPPVTGGCASP